MCVFERENVYKSERELPNVHGNELERVSVPKLLGLSEKLYPNMFDFLFHCTADLQFDWIIFYKTKKLM